ncbi:MAG: UMP kinase [Minisyncoccia bacterium]
MQAPHERIVVSVGGSLIVPDDIDTDFLSRFRDLIRGEIALGHSFAIIAGGGATARSYQEAAHKVVATLPQEDLDWIGIHSTRLNAQLLRNIFAEEAYPHIVKNPTADLSAEEPMLIAGGWKPGWSTDYCAVQIAKNLGARRLVNLSNTDYVYTADPKKDPNAKKIEKISWGDFRNIIPDHWDPGLSSPFDPVAAKEAEALSLEVAVINGAHLDRFSDYLAAKPFIGTTIS